MHGTQLVCTSIIALSSTSSSAAAAATQGVIALYEEWKYDHPKSGTIKEIQKRDNGNKSIVNNDIIIMLLTILLALLLLPFYSSSCSCNNRYGVRVNKVRSTLKIQSCC